MSDRTTIEIDCFLYTVTVHGDQQGVFNLGGQLETSKSSLIAELIAPQMIKLMALSREELMERRLAVLNSRTG